MRLNCLFEDKNNDIPTRKLGKTGFDVPIISLGGQGSLESHGDKENCVEIIQKAFDLGIRYMDTSPIYGESENYYGEAMGGWRDKIILATKTDVRDRDGSLKEIEKSLKRLKTDYIDIWQIHHLDTMEEVNRVTGKNGALEALLEMQEEGVVKKLGITGHSYPRVLLEIMKRHPFDTVLCPVNMGDMSMDPPFIKTVLKEAKKDNMGVIGMKVFAQGFVFHPKAATTSWEPLTYALSQDVGTVIVGMDSVEQLEENVAIAKSFRPMDPKIQKELEEKTKPHKRRACFFRREFGGYDSQKKLDPPYIITNHDIK
ncbi:MAG: aldo/keto reductase [Candidatus Lokiarchaeota archaeon]|nr:aldo/keto reductase [Candidatus Lokiarchaeota archaeon]